MVDAPELRGLPMIGRSVAGVQPGTQPLQALLAKERRRHLRRGAGGCLERYELAELRSRPPI
jgi:hypothetical protein